MLGLHEERLRAALHALYGPQIRQAEAAKASGVRLSRISDVLAARRPLSREDITALASKLRISADYLLGVPGATMLVAEQLHDDLAKALEAYVQTEAIRDEDFPEGWLRDALQSGVDGKHILHRVATELHAEAEEYGAKLRQWADATAAFDRAYGPHATIPAALLKALPSLNLKPGAFLAPAQGLVRRMMQHIMAVRASTPPSAPSKPPSKRKKKLDTNQGGA